MRSRISLLPEAFKRRNKLKKQMYYIITTVASMSVFLALIVTFVVLYRLTLNSNLTTLRDQRILVARQISALKKYEDLDTKITQLEGLLTKASAGSTDWRGTIIKLSDLIPGGVSISEMAATNGKDGSVIKIKGYSIDNYRVGLWIQNIRSINEIKNVQCSYSERKKVGINYFSEYEITATLTTSLPFASTVPSGTATSKEVKK